MTKPKTEIRQTDPELYFIAPEEDVQLSPENEETPCEEFLYEKETLPGEAYTKNTTAWD